MSRSEIGYFRKRTIPAVRKSYSPETVFDRLSHRSSSGPRKSSAGSEAGAWRRPERLKRLKLREYLLLMIEASLSIAARVIQQRVTVYDYGRHKLTEHQKGVYELYAQGYSALVSMFIGCLADSYFRYYTMAFISVAIHFVVICLYTMEEIIRLHPSKGNPYGALMSNICIVAGVLIKSTDFTRLVYALEGLNRRKKSTIYLYLFLHFWVSSYATPGGILVTYFSSNWKSFRSNSNKGVRFPVASFAATAVSMFVFVYFLPPETTRKEDQRGLGCRVVNCLLLATYRKIFRIHKRGKKGFIGNTEGTCDKTTISRTKEILTLYALLLPALGLTFSSMMDTGLFYNQMLSRLKTDDYVENIGVLGLANMFQASFMVLSYFGLWPLLTLIGFKNNATVKFLVGYLLIVLSMFYAASFFKSAEHLPFSTSSGLVRIFNTRKEAVQLIPEEKDQSSRNLLVDSKKGTMALYRCSRKKLFPMRVVFNGTTTNITTFLSVSPGEVTGYVIVDPPEVIRIQGPYLPLREGPPGTNIWGESRIFFYNTATTLKEASVKIKLVQDNQNKVHEELKIRVGIMTTIALKPATYKFKLMPGKIKETVEIQEGGLYGAVIYDSTSTRELGIDQIVDQSSASPWPFICRYIIEGLAAGIGYPTLRAIMYTLAPQGLLAMSFAFLAFLEGITSWIQFIGFKTWHYYVTANVLFAYSVLVASSFVVCMFVSFKYIKIEQ